LSKFAKEAKKGGEALGQQFRQNTSVAAADSAPRSEAEHQQMVADQEEDKGTADYADYADSIQSLLESAKSA
jgi:hypothetical protein